MIERWRERLRESLATLVRFPEAIAAGDDTLVLVVLRDARQFEPISGRLTMKYRQYHWAPDRGNRKDPKFGVIMQRAVTFMHTAMGPINESRPKVSLCDSYSAQFPDRSQRQQLNWLLFRTGRHC